MANARPGQPSGSGSAPTTPPATDTASASTDDSQGTEGVSTADLVNSTPDARDTAEREDTQDTSGKRFRAIPTHGGTTVKVSRADFASLGVDHDEVVFDFRKDKFTVPVGEGGISEKAADALTKHEPTRFEYFG